LNKSPKKKLISEISKVFEYSLLLYLHIPILFLSERNAKFCIVNHPRDILYKRIDDRFDLMLDDGLLDEVEHVNLLIRERLADKSLPNVSIPKAIGLQHMLDYVNGKVSLSVATDLAKRDSRHYAKRQMTWFRNKFSCLFYEIHSELDIL
jgi:tRNA dimethylallyltransferase